MTCMVGKGRESGGVIGQAPIDRQRGDGRVVPGGLGSEGVCCWVAGGGGALPEVRRSLPARVEGRKGGESKGGGHVLGHLDFVVVRLVVGSVSLISGDPIYIDARERGGIL